MVVVLGGIQCAWGMHVSMTLLLSGPAGHFLFSHPSPATLVYPSPVSISHLYLSLCLSPGEVAVCRHDRVVNTATKSRAILAKAERPHPLPMPPAPPRCPGPLRWFALPPPVTFRSSGKRPPLDWEDPILPPEKGGIVMIERDVSAVN